MSKTYKVNWSDIDAALPQPKQLNLEKDESTQYKSVTMMDFKIRGCRKHVHTKHSCLFYFDEELMSKDSLKVARHFPIKNADESRMQMKIIQVKPQNVL